MGHILIFRFIYVTSIIYTAYACYVFPKELNDPCRNKQCGFGARCIASSDGRNASCECPDRCPNYGDHITSRPVCGTDGQDYSDLCNLRLVACRSNTNITVKYEGKCDPCANTICSEPEICQLNEHREPECKCGDTCPLEFTPVCGSDGRTYSNECALRQEACRSRKVLRIIYHGKCSSGVNPCLSVQCTMGEECTINKYGIARCECPSNCEPVMRPVCSKDGRTFSSECEMKKVACTTRTLIEISFAGSCGKHSPCNGHSCQYGSHCVERLNKAQCKCPTCSAEFHPVCGSDGITYGNNCKLWLEACKHHRNITALYEGPCNGCENKKCEFYSTCESDKATEGYCVCPESCGIEQDEDPVCGSDDVTYINECQLKISACKIKQNILVAYKGDCDLCRNVQCKFNAHCNSGKCVCPTDCHNSGNEPVCASTMVTYANECELQRAACNQSPNEPPLNIVFYGDCREKFAITKALTTLLPDVVYHQSRTAVEGNSVEREACKDIHCDYEATCELGPDNFPRCTCKFDCNNTIMASSKPVCASDLHIYPSLCIMKMESCQRQEELRLRPLDLCQGMKVKPCNGETPLRHSITDKELDCGNGPMRQDCPSGSYCHQTTRFAKCCVKDQSSLQKSCENSWFGCCPDGKTYAKGIELEGCPFLCGCNKLGSFAEACDSETQQCRCKPGVGGLKCDRCKPGYWGLPKISSGHQGCIPCGCSMFGSVREDCEQMTGRCVCKSGIQGQKCTICNSVNKSLGPNGCVPIHTTAPSPTSCNDLTCYFDGVCKEKNGFAICECTMKCPDNADNQIVCGSDDQTYSSECHLKLTACQLQKDVVVQGFGSCKDKQFFGTWPVRQLSQLQFIKPEKLRSLSKSARNLLIPGSHVFNNHKDSTKYSSNGRITFHLPSYNNHMPYKIYDSVSHVNGKLEKRKRVQFLSNDNAMFHKR